jgi:predicted O-methyltransferase YrrM
VRSAGSRAAARLRSVTLRRPDVLLALGGAVAIAAAVVTAVAGSRPGLVVLGIAVGLATVGLALGFRVLLGRIDRLAASSLAAKRSASKAARVSGRVERRTGRVMQQVRAVRRSAADQAWLSARDAHRFRTSLDTLPSDTLRLMRAAERLAPDALSLPGLGDWAITPATLLTVIDDVYARTGPVTIVECGSGSSTLFFALALAERGQGGAVVSLENDVAYAAETREHLRRHGVEKFATVVDAPMTDQVLASGEERLWYDIAGLPEIEQIDVLFVDGPFGGSSHQARYPAYPVFAERLSGGALVVLDDTDRPHEKEIVERWLAEAGDGERLEMERKNVRSTFLRVADSR